MPSRIKVDDKGVFTKLSLATVLADVLYYVRTVLFH